MWILSTFSDASVFFKVIILKSCLNTKPLAFDKWNSRKSQSSKNSIFISSLEFILKIHPNIYENIYTLPLELGPFLKQN